MYLRACGTCSSEDGCPRRDSWQRVAGMKAMEVSAQALAAAAALAGRVALYGGAALIMDYGRDAPYPVRSCSARS